MMMTACAALKSVQAAIAVQLLQVVTSSEEMSKLTVTHRPVITITLFEQNVSTPVTTHFHVWQYIL